MVGNLYNITYETVAKWPAPNYVDPEEELWLPPFAIFWLCLATVFVGGRLLLRVQQRSGPFGLDDFFIIIAWIFSVVFTAFACLMVWKSEFGRHTWDVDPSSRAPALYQAWVAQMLYIWCQGATKLSVLLFYRRIMKGHHSRAWMYTVWVLMAITVATTFAMFAAYIRMCTPLSAYWDFPNYLLAGKSPHYTCLNGDSMTIATSVVTIISDFWTAALPCAMFQVHDLGITKRQKIAMNIIFCLGLSVTGVGIVRTYYLWEVGHNSDLAWIGNKLYASGVVELQLGIICCCAPFLRAYFRRYLPDRSASSMSGVTSSSGDTASTERTLVEEESLTALPRMLKTPDLYNEKMGVIVRAPTTGKLKPEWKIRPISPGRY